MPFMMPLSTHHLTPSRAHSGMLSSMYRWNDDTLVVQPDEAEIVKLIYNDFLNGLSAESTEKKLEQMGVKSYKGRH